MLYKDEYTRSWPGIKLCSATLVYMVYCMNKKFRIINKLFCPSPKHARKFFKPNAAIQRVVNKVFAWKAYILSQCVQNRSK